MSDTEIQEKQPDQEKRARIASGKVVSNKMDKSIVAVSYTHLTLPTKA